MFALIQLIAHSILGGHSTSSLRVVAIFDDLLVGFFGGTRGELLGFFRYVVGTLSVLESVLNRLCEHK